MITILNRRELITTYEMKRLSEVRMRLSSNHIDYRVRVINRRSPSPLAAGTRVYTGSAGEKSELTYCYTVFVKKADFEEASRLLKSA